MSHCETPLVQSRCCDVDGVVVIQSLSHQPQCQFVADTARLLVAGSPVLEPDLDGGDVQTEAVCQLTSTLVADVVTAVVLGAQLLQLMSAERCTTTTSTTSTTRKSSTYSRSCTVSSSQQESSSARRLC